MIIDKELLLSDGQEITASALSTNIIDLGTSGRDIGKGEQLYVVLVVDRGARAADVAKLLDISLVNGDTQSLTAAYSVLDVPQKTGADLVTGMVPIVIPIPPSATGRYLGLYYTTDTFTGTTLVDRLAVTAFIAKDVQTNY